MKKTKIALLLVAALALTACARVSGEKSGEIISLNKEGLMFKTNEAELIRGSLSNGSGAFGRPFFFTINNDDVLKVAQQALDQNKPIIVTYKSTAFCPFSSETQGCIFAKSIKIIN